MGRKKLEVLKKEGCIVFTFIYRAYIDFVDNLEQYPAFDIDEHKWIVAIYKEFSKKRRYAIKKLEYDELFENAYPSIKRKSFSLEKIVALIWRLEKKLGKEPNYKKYSEELARTINDKNRDGLIAKELWDYVTPQIRKLRDKPIDFRIKKNAKLLGKGNDDLQKPKEIIDKALLYLVDDTARKKEFRAWLKKS